MKKICICDNCAHLAIVALLTGSPVDVAIANFANRAHVALVDSIPGSAWDTRDSSDYYSPADQGGN